MSFKDFSQFNEEANQLSLITNPSLGCVNNQAENLSQAIRQVRNAAQSYASSYAKVAVWDYSNAGHPSDVTSAERQSVPDNILASARATLKTASQGVKNLIGTTKRGDPLKDKAFQEAFNIAGVGAVFQPWKSETLAVELSSDAVTSILSIVNTGSLNGTTATFSLASQQAASIILSGVRMPRVLVTQGTFKAGCYSTRLATSNLIVTLMFENSTANVYAFIFNSINGSVLYGALENKAGDNQWLYLLPSSSASIGVIDNDADYYAAITKLITEDVETQVNSNSSVTVTIAADTMSTDISITPQTALVDDIQGAYVASTIATPQQLDALEQSLI